MGRRKEYYVLLECCVEWNKSMGGWDAWSDDLREFFDCFNPAG